MRLADRSGFTFIEVLVSLAILGLVGAVLASTCANLLAARHAAFHRDETAADRQLLRQALFTEPSRKQATVWNDVTLPDGRRLRWRAEITPAPVADLFDVVLTMELPATATGSAQKLTENLWLLRPTWSLAEEREPRRERFRRMLAQRNGQ